MIKSLGVLALGLLLSCSGSVSDETEQSSANDDDVTATDTASAAANEAAQIDLDQVSDAEIFNDGKDSHEPWSLEDDTSSALHWAGEQDEQPDAGSIDSGPEIEPATESARDLLEGEFSQPVPEPQSMHAPFDAMLKQHVRDELVDYLLIRRDEHETLDAYLDTLAGTDVTAMTRDEQLAYYINLYNATMVRVITRRVSADYSVSEKDFAVFDEPIVRLKNKSVSLNQLEHEIIRPTFEDPRIHAALVCGARSCPPLLPRAYRADDLDDVLTKNVQDWLADTERNIIDTRKRELRVSSIFDWYAEDFGGKSGIDDFVNTYVPANVRGFSVAFMPYSWDLNIAAPADGAWVRCKSNVSTTYAGADGGRYTLRLRAGDIVESVGTETDGRVTVRVPFEGTTVSFSADTFETYRSGR